MLNAALNKGTKPRIIADKIEVVELEMGTQVSPTTAEQRVHREASADSNSLLSSLPFHRRHGSSLSRWLCVGCLTSVSMWTRLGASR